MDAESVNVHYLSRNAGIVRRNLEYIKYCLRMISRNEYDVVFIKYFKGCSLLRLLRPGKIYIMDIRTGAVNNKKHIRVFEDCLLKIEAKVFSNITVVSESLANKLNIKKYHVVPLGALPLSDRKSLLVPSDEVNLVYVGTFNGRQLEKTIEAVYLFKVRNPHVDIHYYLVGDGVEADKKKVLECIEKFNLKSVVSVEGFVPHHELKFYFEKAHVGIAYIPVTVFYNVQPATKIYEYCLSSIPVLATNTTENIRILDHCFGLVVADNAVDFSYGIERILERISRNELNFDYKKTEKFNWNVVVRDLENYMKNFNKIL